MRMVRAGKGLWTRTLVTAGTWGLAIHLVARVVGQDCPTRAGLLEDAVVELFLAPIGGGLYEGKDDGVRSLLRGR